MEYDFLKELYKPVIDRAKSDESVLSDFISTADNGFILKHNTGAVSAILRFLESEDNIFVLNGFSGAGKSLVADCILDFVNENVLLFKNSYTDGLTPDDVFLSMFKDFSNYHNEKKISLPKVETSVFSEKINAYIRGCDAPMLFLFDSFEIKLKTQDPQRDILDFINCLSKYAKIKIIICSRTFKPENLISQSSVRSYTLSPLSKEETSEYLNENGIGGSAYEIDDFYNTTRGHYILCELSVNIMKTMGYTLTLFGNDYKKSTKNFLEFLISKMLSFATEKYTKPILFLSLLRHGMSGELLENLCEVSKEDIDFLVQKKLLSEKFGKYYVKDYTKNEFIKTVPNEIKIKIHKYINEIYEGELPLKPFDRDLFLSRLTMRREIEYHNKKIASIEEEMRQAGKIIEGQGLSYLSYVKASGYEEKIKEKNEKKKKFTEKIREKRQRNKRYELSEEDSKLLNAGQVKDETTKAFEEISKVPVRNENKAEENEKIPDSMNEFINIAGKYEDEFDFSSAIMYYNQALTYRNDAEFELKQPVIYTKLAICYRKIQNTSEAIKLYKKVYDLYIKNSPDKACESLMSIAEIYSESFKPDKTREMYDRILNEETGISDNMKTRVCLSYSDALINDGESKSAVEYIRKAISYAEKRTDSGLLSECYFKYALLLDDINNPELAEKCYKRCIQICDNPEENTFLASAYSNLSQLYLEADNVADAKKYCELALETDKTLNNPDGMYYSYSVLADIYKNEDEQKSHEYLLKALGAAKRLDDPTYAIAVYIEAGKLYEKGKNYKKALKSYILARKLISANSGEDMLSTVNEAVAGIRKHTGEVEFVRIMNELKKKSNV